MDPIIQHVKQNYLSPSGYEVVDGSSKLDMHGVRISNINGTEKYFICMHTQCRATKKQISIKIATTDGLNHLRNVHQLDIAKKTTKRSQVAALMPEKGKLFLSTREAHLLLTADHFRSKSSFNSANADTTGAIIKYVTQDIKATFHSKHLKNCIIDMYFKENMTLLEKLKKSSIGGKMFQMFLVI